MIKINSLKNLKWLSFVLVLIVGLSFLAVPAFAGGLEGSEEANAEGQRFYDNWLDGLEDWVKDSPFKHLKLQALKKYGILVNPYFKAAFEYTSNTFGSPDPTHSSGIWKFTPGVNITHRGDYGVSGISYEAPFIYFPRFEMQHTQDQNFSAFIDYNVNDRLEVQLSQDIVQQGATGGDPQLKPLEIMDSTSSAVVLYKISDTLLGEGGYTFFNREYGGEVFDRFSYHEQSAYVRSHYQINETTKIWSGLEFGGPDYNEDTSRNAFYWEIPVGIEGTVDVLGGIYYSGRLGFHRRNQELHDRNDFWGILGSLDLRKQWNEKTSTSVGFVRSIQEATFATAPYSDDKTFYANATHIITKRLRGRMNLSYTNRDFEERATIGLVTAKRDDDVFGFGLGFDYAVRRWMVLNLDYKLDRADSNFSDFDSTENRLVVGMTIPV